jgi:hypothetical protein
MIKILNFPIYIKDLINLDINSIYFLFLTMISISSALFFIYFSKKEIFQKISKIIAGTLILMAIGALDSVLNIINRGKDYLAANDDSINSSNSNNINNSNNSYNNNNASSYPYQIIIALLLLILFFHNYQILTQVTVKMGNLLLNIFYKFYSKIKSDNNIQFAFLLPLIFKLENELPTDSSPFVRYAFTILVVAILTLGSFLNIIGYFAALYLIQKYDIHNKYPKYSKIIGYFEKSGKLLIIVEILICI